MPAERVTDRQSFKRRLGLTQRLSREPIGDRHLRPPAAQVPSRADLAPEAPKPDQQHPLPLPGRNK